MLAELRKVASSGRVLAVIGCILVVVAYFGGKADVGRLVLEAFFSRGLFLTVGTVWLVMIIEAELKTLGIIDAMVSHASARSVKTALWVLPAVLGLVPAAAGARISTGLVASLGEKTSGDPVTLAAVNFWFRHVNVFCNPLIAGTILAAGIADIPIGSLVLYGIPFSVAAVAFGWLSLVKGLQVLDDLRCRQTHRSELLSEKETVAAKRLNRVFVSSLLIAVCMAFFAVLPLPVLLAVPAVVGLYAISKRYESVEWSIVVPMDRNLRVLIELISILWFAAATKASGLLDFVAAYLLDSSMPPLPAVLLAAFVLSLTTGVSVSSVAITMPLVAAIFPKDAFVVFQVVAIGFVAQFLTPTHLCLTISAGDFSVSAGDVVKRILPSLAGSCLVGCVIMAMQHFM